MYLHRCCGTGIRCIAGGDEFAMILPETVKEGAIDLAERLKERFAREFNDKHKRLQLSLSIGIASHPEDGTDEKSLIGVADRRMYISKESGGNLISAFDEHENLDSSDEVVLRTLSALVQLMEKRRGWHSLEGINHSQELRALGVELGRRMGLSSNRIYLLEQASMLHDIGTLYLPNALLRKKGALSEQERAEIRKHALIGEEIIGLVASSDKAELTAIKTIVGQHHEWVNGNGYPRGLKGDEILLEARILAVIDAYSAMSSARPHRQALTRNEIFREFEQMSGRQFDPAVVQCLLALEGYTQTLTKTAGISPGDNPGCDG